MTGRQAKTSQTRQSSLSATVELIATLTRRTPSRAPSSLGATTDLVLLEVWRNALHDLVGFGRVVDFERVEVLGSAQLELGDVGLLVLLDSDLIGLGKVLLLSSHDLDELFEVFDFLWLEECQNRKKKWLTILCCTLNNIK